MYADDTALVTSGPNLHILFEHIQSDLNSINKWMSSNNFLINVEKSKHIIFRHNKKTNLPNVNTVKLSLPIIHKNNCFLNINCKCQQLEEVESIKYLGLTIDNRLRWTPHIKNVTNKLIPSLILSYKLKNIIDCKTSTLIYHILIKPIFTYGIIFWGATFKPNNLLSLYKLIRKIQLNFCPAPDKTIFSVEQLYLYNLCLFTHLKNRPLIHDPPYQLRRKRNFTITKPTSENNRHQFVYLSEKVYSSIPEEIREADDLKTFKKEINNLIASNYINLLNFNLYKT